MQAIIKTDNGEHFLARLDSEGDAVAVSAGLATQDAKSDPHSDDYDWSVFVDADTEPLDDPWEAGTFRVVHTFAGAFQAAVREGRWGDAADMVRRFATDKGFREGGNDALADWLEEGRFDGTETPESVAAEWDSI